MMKDKNKILSTLLVLSCLLSALSVLVSFMPIVHGGIVSFVRLPVDSFVNETWDPNWHDYETPPANVTPWLDKLDGDWAGVWIVGGFIANISYWGFQNLAGVPTVLNATLLLNGRCNNFGGRNIGYYFWNGTTYEALSSTNWATTTYMNATIYLGSSLTLAQINGARLKIYNLDALSGTAFYQTYAELQVYIETENKTLFVSAFPEINAGFWVNSIPYNTPQNVTVTVGTYNLTTQETKTVGSTIYSFIGWWINGTATSNSSTYMLTFTGNTSVQVRYEIINVDISSSPSLSVAVSVNGTSQSLPYSFTSPRGAFYTFVALNYELIVNSSYKYTFSYWLINSSITVGSLTFPTFIFGDTNITLVYSGVPYSPPIPFTYAQNALNATYYFRSDTHTVHSTLSYQLQTVNTHTPAFDSRILAGTLNVSYGARVWAIDFFGNKYELSSGTPIAVVTKSTAGGEMKIAYWNCPAWNSMIDALLVRIYERFDSGTWSLRRTFTTNTDKLIRLPEATWVFHYYVIRTVAGGSTNATFGHGSYTVYNSRIDLQYYKANPWDIALARLYQNNFFAFMFVPWTYWFGNLFWVILFIGLAVMSMLRSGSFKPILAWLWILGGSGSIIWAIFPASMLYIAALMLGLAMAITILRLFFK
jgi:hypothetical protein